LGLDLAARAIVQWRQAGRQGRCDVKITAIETIALKEFPNLLWVQIHTDAGIIGLGETFYGAQSVAGFIHETATPYLLGKDPLQIDKHNRHFLNHYLGFKSVGAEMRGASAIDIALWDIFGQVTEQPIWQLLGGRSRDTIRTYNTCAGYRYVRAQPEQLVTNWGLPAKRQKKKPYEDLDGFLNDAGALAESLISEGYRGMKNWPFDP
jgi:galactonate dehydratase